MVFIHKIFKMKAISIISALLLCGLSLFSQSWISSTQITGTNDINVIQSISDVNDNTIVLGEYFGEISLGAGVTMPSNGGRDYFLFKFDSDGALDWATNIGGAQDEFVYGGVGSDQAGNIYVSGAFMNKVFFSLTDSIVGANQDIFLAKYTETGGLEWYKNVGTGFKAQRPSSLTINEIGNIILAGTFKDSIKFDETTTLYSDNAVSDYFYSEFDDNGNLNWVKQIKASNNPLSGVVFGIKANTNFLTMTGVFSDTVFIEDEVLVSDSLFDVHLIRTNLQGDLLWLRKIGGKGYVYSYNITYDPDENVYVSGYYDSPSLTIDSTDTEQVTVEGNAGGKDFFVAKFNSEGTFQWIRTNGGIANDKLFDIAYYNQEINVCGYFTDSIKWGGIQLLAAGNPGDQDMFTGALDLEGNYRSANQFGGRNNSTEEAYSISVTADKKYNVIRSNSDLLYLGSEAYYSTSGKYYLVFGVVGCLPISIDNAIPTNVPTCFGDSTGSIQVSASGGFGAPWQYSIDNGLSYQKDLTFFPNLPAGDYEIVVIDAKNCTQDGPVVTIQQPDLLALEVISTADITAGSDGSIVVAASGGKSPYTYTLQPNGTLQGFGTFSFGEGDSGIYVVEVNDGQNCGPVASDSIEILDLTYVGLEDLSGIALKIFPNPSTDVVTVEMPLEADEVNMELLNLAGQVVLSRQAFTTGGLLRESLDVSDLAQGMYMLRVNGQTLQSAIVVN
jgi:hypothetical protein